ncbi:MAG: RNA polymerase sigma factor [Planctomycetota bacterium]|jgi:RNA polymerase sigma-70 factor (ECF subfamily)
MAEKPGKADPDSVGAGSDSQPDILRALSAEELARRSQQGCRASFAQLVERYGMRLFRFLHYKTNSLQDTEDLVQDTFVKAYENIHRYCDSWKFSTWLFTIATRLANSHFRRLRSSRMIEDIESEDLQPGQMMIERESNEYLWAMARDLSINQYHALWLKYAQGMSIKEIAKVMRKSQVNVKVILYRARINLAKELQKVTVEEVATEQKSSKEIITFMKVEGA